jgi:hypothetical protein
MQIAGNMLPRSPISGTKRSAVMGHEEPSRAALVNGMDAGPAEPSGGSRAGLDAVDAREYQGGQMIVIEAIIILALLVPFALPRSEI